MINTNANKMARSITQLNTISMTKANSQYGSKNPSIQMIQKPKVRFNFLIFSFKLNVFFPQKKGFK